MAYDKRAKRYIIEFKVDNKWVRSGIEGGKAFATKEEATEAMVAVLGKHTDGYHVRTK